MFKKLFARSKRFVGVDWGKEKIKVATIEWNGKLSVHGLFSVDKSPEDWNSQADEEFSSSLVAVLSQVADNAGVNNENIVLAIDGNHVSLRHIKIPYMSKQELAKVIKWEVDKLFPGLSEEISYRYLVLGEIVDNIKYFNVLLITVNKNIVSKYINIFQAAGLKLAAFDIPALALWNLYKENSKENVALIYWNTSMIHIVVMKNNQIHFIRSLPKYDLQNLSKQLELTFEYFKHAFPVPTIQRIILSGEYEGYQDLAKIIKEELKIEVQFSVPVLLKSAQSYEPDFGVALGLALRGAVSYV